MSKETKLNTRAVHFIVCLFFAFFLWFYVSYAVSPLVTKTITNIPVTIIGEDKLNDNNLSAKLLSDNKVDVKVTAERTLFKNITVKNARATVDVSAISEAGEKHLTASVSFLSASEAVVDTKKATVTFLVETYLEKDFPIVLGDIKTPSDGYYINNSAQFNNGTTVKVSGITDDVEKVALVKTEKIDLSDAIDNVTMPYQLIPLDKDDKVVKDVKLSAEKASLTFEIYKEVLMPLFVENVPESKKDIKYTIDPPEVLVRGPAAIIDQTPYIAIDYKSSGRIMIPRDVNIEIDDAEPSKYSIIEEEE